MSQPAIRVEGLSKKYNITHETRGRYRTLRETVMDAATAPVRWIQGRRGARQEEFWALDDVSFEVEAGEVVGIIGRNGAGKSTLLKILSRITKPSVGRIELNGRVGSLLEVGTGFHPELTGRENVYLNGSILGMTRREIDRKFDEIVAFAEVEKFLDTPVKRYSSGMYVRLAFAVAAHLEPEILIIDEVLAVGDAGFQEKCLAKMKECAIGGSTVLLVSHQLNNVAALSQRSVWLDRGRIVAQGATSNVLAEYIRSGKSASPPGEWIDLADRTRRGDGVARFEAVRFFGREGTSPRPDGPLSIVVKLAAHQASADIRASVHIRDPYGALLIDLNTEHAHRTLYFGRGAYHLHFCVERLHLAPGQYRVDLGVGSATDHHDDVTDAFGLTVEGLAPVADPAGGDFGKGRVTRTFSVSVTPAARAEE